MTNCQYIYFGMALVKPKKNKLKKYIFKKVNNYWYSFRNY